MAHYIDFDGGSASIVEWSATGAFTITFKTVYDSNNDITAGNVNDSAQYFGAVNGGFRIAIGSGYSPGFSIANGDEVEGSIVRDASNNVTITLNGQQFTTAMAGTFTLNKIGGNGNATYISTTEDFYYLTLDNTQGGVRDYTPDASGIPGATLSGSYTVVEYGVDPEVDSITVQNAVNINQPYPILSGNGQASFDVTYNGTPTALEYELFDADTAEVIQAYTAFDNAPSGGASTLTISTPATQRRYLARARFANDVTVSNEQTTPWLTAHFIELAGQSLIEHLGRDDDSLTPAGVYKYTTANGVFQSAVGRGQAELGKVIADELGCSVVIANTAVGGTCMTSHCAVARGDGSDYWANPSSALSTAMMSSIGTLASDGKMFRLAFGQGQTDAVVGSPPEDYLTGLNSVIDRVRAAATEPSGSELPVVVGLLGRNTSTGNDSDAQAIREKQLEYLDGDPNSVGVLMYTYGTDDGTHPNDAGDIALGKALAYAMLGYTPPKVINISANNALTEITLTFDKDLKNDSTYSTEGVRVNSGDVEQTVSSFARAGARFAVITLSQPIPTPNNVDVYVGYGTGSTSSLLTYPSSGDGSELVMIPLAESSYDLSIPQNITADCSLTIQQPIFSIDASHGDNPVVIISPRPANTIGYKASGKALYEAKLKVGKVDTYILNLSAEVTEGENIANAQVQSTVLTTVMGVSVDNANKFIGVSLTGESTGRDELHFSWTTSDGRSDCMSGFLDVLEC